MMGSIKGWFSSKKDLQPKEEIVAVNRESAPVDVNSRDNRNAKNLGTSMTQTNSKSARLTQPSDTSLVYEKQMSQGDNSGLLDTTLSSIGLNDSSMMSNGIQRKNVNMAKIKRLPPTFAQKMLDYEMEIESGQFDADTVNELFELYGQAVEFYNIKNDKRCQYYETKIQNMLVKPEIMMAMAKGKQVEKQKTEEEQQKKAQDEKMKRVKLLRRATVVLNTFN